MKLFLLLTLAASALADCRSGMILDGEVSGLPLTTTATASYVVNVKFQSTHICSGAAIAKQYAVTAARCVVGVNQEDLTIRSGSASSTSTIGSTKHTVEEIIVHPDYDSGSLEYDIAIIKVTSSKKFSSTVSLASSVPLLSSAATYGWSLKSSLLDSWLRHINAPLVSSSSCASTYGFQLSDAMLCAGLSSSLQCQGDTGGPLIANSKLVGVASFGYGCSKSAPGIYTSIPAVIKWIESYI